MQIETDAYLATLLRQMVRNGECPPPTEAMREAVDTAIAEVSL